MSCTTSMPSCSIDSSSSLTSSADSWSNGPNSITVSRFGPVVETKSRVSVIRSAASSLRVKSSMSFSTASIFRSRPGIADPQEITIAPFANDAMAVMSLSLAGILAWHSAIAYCCQLERSLGRDVSVPQQCAG